MAFLQVSSTNPQISFIWKKNPASGMNMMEHKSGHLCGWYSPNNQSYNVWFKDQVKANSYGDQDYNNTLQYSSPLFVLDALNLFFSENIKKTNDKDTDGFDNSVLINLVSYANNNLIQNFVKQFPDYKFEVEEVQSVKRITISTKKTMGELINLTAVLFALFELRKTDLYVDASLLTKYLHCLNRINAPYFVRYLFKMYLLRNMKDFNECKDILEDGKYNLSFGDNYLSRVQTTLKHIDTSLPVVDIGCGEGKFMNYIAPKVPTYLGFDKDLSVLDLAEQKIIKNQLSSAKVFQDELAFKTAVNGLVSYNALLIEVIEHMPIESAKKLISEVLSLPKAQTVVITTPDRNFNKHYLIDGFRHDDHHYELTMMEFQTLINSLTPPSFKVNYINIGDSIDGVSTTVGAVLTRIS